MKADMRSEIFLVKNRIAEYRNAVKKKFMTKTQTSTLFKKGLTTDSLWGQFFIFCETVIYVTKQAKSLERNEKNSYL